MGLNLQKNRLWRICASLAALSLWTSCQSSAPQAPKSQPHSLNVSLSSCDATELIQAVSQANAAGPGPHQITLQAGCTYTLNHADNYWYGPNGLPPISSDITIVGNGATIERSSNAINFRFFYVAGPPTPTAAVGGAWGLDRGRLVLMDLTLRGGLAKGGNGGAVGGGGMGAGGALFLQGDVTLLRVTISGCRAEGGRADSTRPDQFGGGGMGGDGGFIGGGGFRGAGGDNGGDFLGLGEGGTDLAGGAGQGTQSATTSDGAGLGQLGGNAISNNEGARGGDGGAGANAGGGAGFGGAGFGDDAPGGGGFGGGGGSHNFIGSGPNGGGGGGVGGGGGYGGGGGFGGGGGGGGGNRTNGGQGGFGGGSGGSSGSAVLSLYGGGSGGSGNPTLITSKGGGGGMGAGGAIFVHQGSLTAVNSTLAENTAQGGNGGTNQGEQGAAQGGAGSGRGGAIFNLNGTVRLLHTTVARNTVAAGTPGAAQTAGVDSPGPANIASGGAVYNLAFGRDPIAGTLLNAALILQNSVLADSNGGLDLISEMAFSQSPVSSATVDASAPNIIESQSTIFSGASPGTGIQGVDPKLGGLADNGGLTHTLAAPADSPVADAADRILCADPLVQNRDQRNLFRPNCGCSLGAFEAKAAIHQQGEACGANSECSTCFCVDGVCCNNACSGSDPSSCQACSIAAGAPQDGTCQPRLAEQVCRPSADRYDPAEVCDGTSITCPPNVDNVVLSHKGGGGLSTGCTCTALPGVTTSPPSTFIVASLLLAALALALRPLRRIGRRRD